MIPAAWMVVYGEQSQYKALFVEQARAEQFAATHHGVIVLLYGDGSTSASQAPGPFLESHESATDTP